MQIGRVLPLGTRHSPTASATQSFAAGRWTIFHAAAARWPMSNEANQPEQGQARDGPMSNGLRPDPRLCLYLRRELSQATTNSEQRGPLETKRWLSVSASRKAGLSTVPLLALIKVARLELIQTNSLAEATTPARRVQANALASLHAANCN